MNDWQPIETAPKDGREVLIIRDFGVSTRYGAKVGSFSPPKNAWVSTYEGQTVYEPTHWMPLPAPPV